MEFNVLNLYEHRCRDVDASVGWLFFSGVDTRKLKDLARELFCKKSERQTAGSSLA